jgi:large subunit ribosomal protein L5
MTLNERYRSEIRPALAKSLAVGNPMAIPTVTAVTVAVGIPAGSKDAKLAETAESVLARITGQKPVKTKAKISISNFKIRKGMVVGLRVTLRGPRMWSFLEKFLGVTFPRVRDFRGITNKIVDATGNASVGFKEFLPFPEIRPDEVERVHGLQVTVTTTAGTRARGLELFKALGFPFND